MSRTLSLLLRLGVTAGVFAYLFSRIDAKAVAGSLKHIPTLGTVGALVLLFLAVATGIARWRVLLYAYGAQAKPRWAELWRWYFVAMFYNLLPGAVGGDVLRGYATRHYFADGSAAQSVGVVFVERVLGFAGLFILAGAATSASPVGREEVLLYASLGLCAATGAVVALAIGRRLGPRLPGRIGRLAGSLPAIVVPRAFVLAVALSVVTHTLVSFAGHVLISSLAPQVTVAQSLTFFPLGTLAAYFPLTVAGAGARDTALVVLFSRIGVAQADALATSLSLLFLSLLLSGIGGLLQSPARVIPANVAAAEPRRERTHGAG